MADRYFMTGVQLGIIITALEELRLDIVCNTLCKVKEKQYMGDSADLAAIMRKLKPDH